MASGIIPNNVGCENFNLSTTVSGFRGRGISDKASKTVRIFCSGSTSTNISASTTLFTVPSEYRPSSQQEGVFFGITSSGQVSGNLHVEVNGNISQGETNVLRAIFGYAEYKLE